MGHETWELVVITGSNMIIKKEKEKIGRASLF